MRLLDKNYDIRTQVCFVIAMLITMGVILLIPEKYSMICENITPEADRIWSITWAVCAAIVIFIHLRYGKRMYDPIGITTLCVIFIGAPIALLTLILIYLSGFFFPTRSEANGDVK